MRPLLIDPTTVMATRATQEYIFNLSVRPTCWRWSITAVCPETQNQSVRRYMVPQAVTPG